MRKIDVQTVADLLKANDNILILTHISPDGDTLGSATALARALLKLHKNVRIACGDEIPSKYNYLFSGLSQQEFTPDFVMAVDVADIKLLGKTYETMYENNIDLCIDHHPSNTGYAQNLYLDICAATCEMIYFLILALNVPLDRAMADCLYTGISTDTGCFRYSNVTPRTHKIAAELLEEGADAGEINRVMFETKTRRYIKLQAEVLNRIEMHLKDKCAFVLLTQDMLKKSGCTEAECDGVSSIPRKVEGVLAGVTVREKTDGSYKVSLRTYAPVDASKICQKMGGGGHARAAGCSLDGTKYETEKQKLLDLIAAEIEAI